MIQRQLLPYARLVFAQGDDATTDRRDLLADGEVETVTVDGQIALSTSASKPRVRVSTHAAPQ